MLKKDQKTLLKGIVVRKKPAKEAKSKSSDAIVGAKRENPGTEKGDGESAKKQKTQDDGVSKG